MVAAGVRRPWVGVTGLKKSWEVAAWVTPSVVAAWRRPWVREGGEKGGEMLWEGEGGAME